MAFNDLGFDAFNLLDFDEFNALDGFDSYSASFYAPDDRLSTVAGFLSFLTVLPRADSDVSAADRLQILEMSRSPLAAEPSVVSVVDEGHLVGGVLPLAGGLA